MRKRKNPLSRATDGTVEKIVADLERRPLDEGPEARDLRLAALREARAELSGRRNERDLHSWAEPKLEKARTFRVRHAAGVQDARAVLQAGVTGWVDGVAPEPPEEAEEPPVSPAVAALQRAARSDAEKRREAALAAWPTWNDQQQED
jgi:hypothetical protein